MQYCNINGSFFEAGSAAVPVQNSAFFYGLGVFETMLVQDGVIRLWNYHADRWSQGLLTLGMSLPEPYGKESIHEEVLSTVVKNGLGSLCRVRLQFYTTAPFGHAGPAHFVITCAPLDRTVLELNQEGLLLGVASGIAKAPGAEANFKSCSAMVYHLAMQQARQHGWDDALVLNTAGNVAESAIANVFWVKDGQLYTPPLSEACVAGVMRRHLLDVAPGILQKPLSPSELEAADGLFLTNAIRGISWVARLGKKQYGRDFITALHKVVFP